MSGRDTGNSSPLHLFGLRLRDARIQFGFSLEQFAGRLGVSAAHLSNLEHGRREPTVDLLTRIAADLNLSLDYLLLGRADGDKGPIVFRSDDELLAAELGEPMDPSLP